MKKQSIKSLTAQTENIEIAGFVLKNFKSGDYGYNLAYGTVDGKISVAFRIPYQAENDGNAPNAISEHLECGVLKVRYVASKLCPQGSVLTDYIDGENLAYIKIGLNVDGHGICFIVPVCYWPNNRSSYSPPIFYNQDEILSLTKKTIAIHIRNVKKILNTSGFELIKYELANGGEDIHEHGKCKFIKNVIISGKAYGVENSFVIKNFESENIKKRMKSELKNFKTLSLGKTLKKKSKPLKTIDLRNYNDVADSYAHSKKLEHLYYNAHNKYTDSVRLAECKTCENYDIGKDICTYRFMGIVDYENRFNSCDPECEKIDRLKKDMSNLIKRKNDLDEYNKTVFVPTVIKFFEDTDPSFIYWLTGETVSWRDMAPDTQTVIDNNDVSLLHLLLSEGSTGNYIWEGNVITLRGESIEKDKKELLALGRDVKHNIGNTYIAVRDNELIVRDGKIVYDSSNDGNIESEIERRRKGMEEYARSCIRRLTHNYSLFKTPQDKYTVNAMLAVYFGFIGENQSAKEYKSKIAALDKNKITPDEKLETLLKVI